VKEHRDSEPSLAHATCTLLQPLTHRHHCLRRCRRCWEHTRWRPQHWSVRKSSPSTPTRQPRCTARVGTQYMEWCHRWRYREGMGRRSFLGHSATQQPVQGHVRRRRSREKGAKHRMQAHHTNAMLISVHSTQTTPQVCNSSHSPPAAAEDPGRQVVQDPDPTQGMQALEPSVLV
jgi:hypothetical protein